MWLLPVLRKRPMEGLKLTTAQFTVFFLAAIILTAGLAALSYAGTFTRYLADDYCFSRLVIENGFWGAQVKSFVTWSDRFSTVFVTDLIDYAGIIGIRFTPLVLIGILLGGMVGSIIRLNRALNLPLTRFEVYLIGALLSYGVLITTPSQFQSLFWRAGSITYLLPLAILPYLGWMIFSQGSGRKKWILYIGIAVVSFLNAGFSETTLALQMSLIILALAFLFWLRKSEQYSDKSLVPAWIALGGTLLASGLMLASPGNLVRMDAMAKSPDILKGTFLAVRYALGFIYHALQASWLPILLIAVFMLCLSLQRDWNEITPRKVRWLFWAIPVGVLFAIIACCAPSALAQGAYPEDRALIAAQWILVIGSGSWVYLLGTTWMQSRQSKPGFQIKPTLSNGLFVLVMLSFYFAFMALVTLSGIPALKQRAADWDNRLISISQQKTEGFTEVVVAPLDSVERIKELDDDPTHWVNKCAAVYYGVKTIRAE